MNRYPRIIILTWLIQLAVVLPACTQATNIKENTANNSRPAASAQSVKPQAAKSVAAKPVPKNRSSVKSSQPEKSIQHYPVVVLGEAFTLKIGNRLSLPNSELNFKIYRVHDNRCPLEMKCELNGEVAVILSLYRLEEQIGTISITANKPFHKIITDKHDSYDVQLLELRPYPTVQFIDISHYVAELIIKKAS